MRRRLVGVVLLIWTIVAVAAVQTVNGKRTAGLATAVTLPPPPQVGDCVLPPLNLDPKLSGPAPEISVTAIRFGSCSGAINGEVVGVHTGDVALNAVAPTAPCFPDTASFAGLQVSGSAATLAGLPSGDPTDWSPTIGARAFRIVPTQAERNGGHDWVACLAVPTMRGEYQGSLRTAYRSGRMPDQFGLCWTGTDLTAVHAVPDLLPCNEPHTAELLATGWIKDRSVIVPGQVESSCLHLAGAIMRTDDPTRGGLLTIVMRPFQPDGRYRPNDPLSVGCYATAANRAQLSGTVIGLGDRPVPLAG